MPKASSARDDYYPYLDRPLGDDGRFRIEGLIPGVAYDLDVRTDNANLGDLATGIKLEPGTGRDLGDVKIKPPGDSPSNPRFTQGRWRCEASSATLRGVLRFEPHLIDQQLERARRGASAEEDAHQAAAVAAVEIFQLEAMWLPSLARHEVLLARENPPDIEKVMIE